MDDVAHWPQRRPKDISRVSRSPGVVGNTWVIAGTRIPTTIVWSLYQAGYDVDKILAEHPFLTREDVQAAIDHERQQRDDRRQAGEEAMSRFQIRPLPQRSALLAGREPPDDLGFRSERLQIWYNHSDEPWEDPCPHLHDESDECFIVLRGALVVEVEGERFTVGPREFCCFPRGIFHAVVAVHPPVETLMIRAPSIADKRYQERQPKTASRE